LQYHDGFLALDTMVVGSRFSAALRTELAGVASHARWASDEGMVHLLQRRLGPGRFAYLAVMRLQKDAQRSDRGSRIRAHGGRR
jgi:hypothetical protein